MKMREMENAFRYRRIPYPKRSIEIITLLAITSTLFLFFHTNKLNSRLREMEEKLQPSEFTALGLTGANNIASRSGARVNDANSLQGTYQYLKNTGQLLSLDPKLLNNTKFATRDFLFFNRVPKVGSEQLIELMRLLSLRNSFGFSRAPFSEPVLARLDKEAQEELAGDIIDMGQSQAYSMHVNYINFRKFDLLQPIYINMIRDPIERVISWFYYRRAPWTAVQMFKLTKKFKEPDWYKKSFAECVKKHEKECRYDQNSKFKQEIVDHRRQSLFFCGHDAECEPFNSDAAIQLAIKNVERDFAVVGSWEDLNVTLSVLEHYVPKYFQGASKVYFDPTDGIATKRRNSNHLKPHIGEDIRQLLRKNFTKEYEFYNFCKQRLYKQYFAINKKNTIHK